MTILESFLNIVDPFKIYRKYVIRPLVDIGLAVLGNYKEKTQDSMSSIRDIILRVAIGLFAGAIITWTAVFMYIAFYYAYMPTVAHMRPVHMQLKTCDINETCSFPSAHVPLTKKQQLLMVGQPYKVIIMIDMPESPQNQELGMFMVCAEMRDQKTNLRGHSCRTAMLHYKSNLITWISTWITSPLLVLGFREETQNIPIELFSSYEDDQTHPVTDVYVEIQSRRIQFYSVSLHITAHFTGLRYIMFHWPILSSILGISTNLFFIMLICLLSWYHWSDTTWIDNAKEKYKSIRSRSRSQSNSGAGSGGESTSIDGETNFILDDDEFLGMDEIKTISKSDDFERISKNDDDGDNKKDKPSGSLRLRKSDTTSSISEC